MNTERINLDNADILAATGVSATTLQTWANRGMLALSEAQKNPGPGQKRLYSRLDAARIAVVKSLIARGLSTSAAGQIALRLERSPQTSASWRSAIQHTANHIHLFVDGTDVVTIYVGNDPEQLARLLITINEPMEAGVAARGVRQFTQMKTNAAVFDVGPDVSRALQVIEARRRYDLSFTTLPVIEEIDEEPKIQAMASPTVGSSGKPWRGVFAAEDLLRALETTLALSAQQVGSLRRSFSSPSVRGPIQLGGMTGLCPLSVPEDTLVGLGLTEEMKGAGVTLGAHLLEDGTVVTWLSGSLLSHPSPSRPQHIDMLRMQLNNSPLSPDQKEEFLKTLGEKGAAEIFLPRHTSTFFAG